MHADKARPPSLLIRIKHTLLPCFLEIVSGLECSFLTSWPASLWPLIPILAVLLRVMFFYFSLFILHFSSSVCHTLAFHAFPFLWLECSSNLESRFSPKHHCFFRVFLVLFDTGSPHIVLCRQQDDLVSRNTCPASLRTWVLPRAHVKVEGENRCHRVVLGPPHMCLGVCMLSPVTYTQNNNTVLRKKQNKINGIVCLMLSWILGNVPF